MLLWRGGVGWTGGVWPARLFFRVHCMPPCLAAALPKISTCLSACGQLNATAAPPAAHQVRARARPGPRISIGLGINNSKLCGCVLIDIGELLYFVAWWGDGTGGTPAHYPTAHPPTHRIASHASPCMSKVDYDEYLRAFDPLWPSVSSVACWPAAGLASVPALH